MDGDEERAAPDARQQQQQQQKQHPRQKQRNLGAAGHCR